MNSHQVHRGQRPELVLGVAVERCDCHVSIDCYSQWASCLWAKVSRTLPILKRMAYQDEVPEEVAPGLVEGIVHTAEVAGSMPRQCSSMQLSAHV